MPRGCCRDEAEQGHGEWDGAFHFVARTLPVAPEIVCVTAVVEETKQTVIQAQIALLQPFG